MSKTTSALVALGVVAGLGAAALPLSSYAVDPATDKVGVTLKIDDELTIEADKSTTDKVDLSGTGHTGDVTLTVVSNNQKGYNLGIMGSATTNPTSLTSENDDEIVAGSGTFAAPAALSTTTSEWGYRLASVAAFTEGLYAGVTTNNDVIKTTAAPTGEAGDETVVTFGASIKDGQPAGTYAGEVTFTATNNANA